MKKVFLLFLSFLSFIMCVSFTACSEAGDENSETDYIEYYPEKPVFGDLETQNKGVPDDLGVEPETDYSNIIAFTEFDEYDSQTEKILFFARNNNPGKGFWFSFTNQLERFEDGDWIQQKFIKGPMPPWDWGFNFAMTPDGFVESEEMLNTSFLVDDLISGKYRIVVFVGDDTLYAEFTLQQNAL